MRPPVRLHFRASLCAPSLSLKPCWQMLVEKIRLHCLAIPLEHFPVTADHKFCEIPFDGGMGRMAGGSTAQEFVDLLGVGAVDVCPLHQGRCWQAVLTDVEL
eukprot:CAMPEP_0119089622 /NCGR_PEP_ID=MMETSP1178-20130426/149630_1 /TAXON_ID=33656 /ORGANISM="unid sp, Strain CCMP2000" /LENGTH=101 /DNA_ID=CAMNT_0007072987 /DNA_START=59 /DNA_END=364 /DNA_ORIENTATION=-